MNQAEIQQKIGHVLATFKGREEFKILEDLIKNEQAFHLAEILNDDLIDKEKIMGLVCQLRAWNKLMRVIDYQIEDGQRSAEEARKMIENQDQYTKSGNESFLYSRIMRQKGVSI